MVGVAPHFEVLSSRMTLFPVPTLLIFGHLSINYVLYTTMFGPV